MSEPRSAPGRGMAALGCAVALAACHPNQNLNTAFPLTDGFLPLEPMVATAAFPAPVGGDDHPEGLGPIVAVPNFAHHTSHARGYVHAPLARVYAALQIPDASFIHNDVAANAARLDGPPVLGVEPQFPISFRVRYVNPTIIGDVHFEVTYRGGLLSGTETDGELGLRYQKTWGTEHIPIMAGSLVARPVVGFPDVTEVEMIAWLKADTKDQAGCDGTLTDLFGDLLGVLPSIP